VSEVYSRAYRGWLLTLLLAAYACSFVDRIIISVVGQPLIAELGLSDLQFGLLGGMAFAIFYTAFGLPIARLAERRGRTLILSSSIALWSLMTMLCGVAQSYAQLLLFRMGVGVGEAGCTPVSHSLISDHYPPARRASALSVYFLGVPLGTLLGAFVGGWVGEALGWRQALIWAGAPGLALALLVWLTVREPTRGHSEGLQVGLAAPPLRAVLARVRRVPSLWLLAIGCTLTTMAANGISTFAPPYFVRGFGLRLGEVGLYFGFVMGISGLAGILAGGFGADLAGGRDRRWYAWIPAIGVVLSGPLYALAYSQTSIWRALPLILGGGLCLSLYVSPVFAVAQNLVEPRMRASISAMLLLAMNLLGQGLGPTLMGQASDALAARRFGIDYRARCLSGPVVSDDARRCAEASTIGLRQTLVGTAATLPAGAIFFVLAARTLRRDLEDATPA
jgi:predicted MFS family arabinose efflux permease